MTPPCPHHGPACPARPPGPDTLARIGWVLADAPPSVLVEVLEVAIRLWPQGARPEWRSAEEAPCP